MDPIKDYFQSLNSFYTEQRDLAAIWLSSPIQTAAERTVRIAPGALVNINEGKLIDCIGEPTHKVIGCLGTLYNQFELTVIDLKTNEPSQIKL